MKIIVVHKRPQFPAEVVTVPNTLEAFQGLLDGGMLTAVALGKGLHVYVDDEGLLKDLPLNFLLNGEPIVGPAIFSRTDGRGDDIGLKSEEALQLARTLNDGSLNIR